jgi:hypothetical protein
LLTTSSVCGPDKSRNPTGANFIIKRDNGLSVSNGITPATVTLNSSAGYFTPAKYTVEFTRKGETQSIPISASINGWYVGNLLFGGLIGFLIVDPATGAMWKLDDTVIANFAQSVTIKNGKKEVQIAHIDDVPLHKRSQLVALN